MSAGMIINPYSYAVSDTTWTANNATISTYDGDLKAVWHFSTGALTTDSFGSNTLTNNNSVAENANGISGYCADFNGSTNYFSIANNADIRYNGNDMMVSYWFNATSVTGTQAHLAKTNNYLLRQEGTGYKVRWYRSDGTGIIQTASTTFSTGSWYHIFTGVVDSQTFLYVNGSSEGTPQACSGAYSETNNLTIGSNATADYYTDRLDEAVEWNDVTIATASLGALATALWNSGTGAFYTG